jgi:hypothetical protein
MRANLDRVMIRPIHDYTPMLRVRLPIDMVYLHHTPNLHTILPAPVSTYRIVYMRWKSTSVDLPLL